jgi:uncharacterized protein with ParB-like and HNH nuclease domain
MTEDTSGIFKPEAKTIMKIFGDADSYYQIPDYQRPYSWEDEQIEQLWDDVYSAMESGDESYFLGPMILIRTSDGHFEVVDGQQRLSTLTILFCVIRDLYETRLKAIDGELVNSIRDAIKSLVKGKHRLKLITQLHYQNQFEQEILNGVKFPSVELTKKQREENKFINAALIFKENLEELSKNGGVKAIKEFADYLLRKVEMITITCSKQEYAIKLFQILNTRGLELSHADLIKSHLYGRLDNETTKQQFISTWCEVETVSKQMDESITDLFTYYEYYLLARNPKRTLYEELKEQFKGHDSNSIIFGFKKFVEFFNEIFQQQSKLAYSFWYLPNQVFWKAILTSAKKENFHDFLGLCRELRRIYYSYWIAGYTTSKIKQLSFNLIGWLRNKKTLQEIRNEIGAKMMEDKVVERMRKNLEEEVYGYSWLKPPLVLVEYEQTDDSKLPFIDLDRQIHVDHILPQDWQAIDYWKKLWTKERANYWLHRLGNVTLLSGRKNISASNNPFPAKKDVYRGKGLDGTTAFLITQAVMDKENWTEKEVEERQNWITGQIERILGVSLLAEYSTRRKVAIT